MIARSLNRLADILERVLRATHHVAVGATR